MSTKRSKPREESAYSQKPWLKHYDFWVPDEINFPRQPIYQILNLAALYFTDRPATATVEELIEYCRVKLARYKVPSFIEFAESLPKSAVGKVLRRELRDAEEAGRNAR